MVTRIEFIDQGNSTRVISRTESDAPEARQTVLSMGMEEGLTETWHRLDEYLASR